MKLLFPSLLALLTGLLFAQDAPTTLSVYPCGTSAPLSWPAASPTSPFTPGNENIWYVGVGSGGVWKTKNAGITWEPIFDEQPSYSIGAITIDPNHPATVWVGTGENVGGRHIGFGDGIYRSDDGGKNWKAMGLPESEHISKIVVHTREL